MFSIKDIGESCETCNNNDALLKAGALHTAIFNSAHFSIIATDAQGMVQLFNVGAQRMLGYTADEVIGQLLPDALHTPSESPLRTNLLWTDCMVDGVTPSLASATPWDARTSEEVCETTWVCKDGRQLDMVVSVTPLRDAQGQSIGFLVVGSDTTERKRTDVELKKAMHAVETASNAKSEFISRMSHELRTPLNAILGFAQLIESGTPAPTPIQQRSVEQILKGGWYLLELINEILDLALVESGRLALSIEPVSVAEVMQECRTMIEPLTQSHNVHMHIGELGHPGYVFADRTRLKQVMINLLMNALKYNRPGGSLSVEFSSTAVQSLRISVRDTGVGLTPAQLPQLFQPFNRLGKEASAEEGTGIGLVVTKRLVELMGGLIGVESTFGVGSVFWVELPLTTAPELDSTEVALVPAEALPANPDIEPFSVLYVEDNPANLDLVEQIIARRADVKFFSAAEAGIGIAFARSHLPDVILMDINLPGISGMDAMRILRADPRTAHIPVLALSANAVPRDIQNALAAGFLDYITKPILVSSFLQALDTALQHSKKKHKPLAQKEAAEETPGKTPQEIPKETA
jgi:signal transduction histidine kinase/DNA-binding NarL/FixJ family response regulator